LEAGNRSGRPKRLLILASIAIAGLTVLGAVSALARSHAPHGGAATLAPLRVVIYETAPGKTVKGRPAAAGGGGTVSSHLAALAWARADAVLVHWNGRRTASDRQLAALLAGTASPGTQVHAAALIKSVRGSARTLLRRLAKSRAASQGYLHIQSRPAVFVALRKAHRSCARAHRWRAAARAWWLGLAAFPGYERCRGAADVWFRDSPVARTAKANGSFLIRPGYWPSSARAPRVTRSIAAWRRSIRQMVASHASLQLIDSLNDWSHGSAIEASRAWASASGFGLYLDALHDQASVSAQRPPPALTTPVTQVPAPQAPGATPVVQTSPAVDAASASAVTAHEATLTGAVSGGGTPATWWVEYGPTPAYGQATSPTSLPPDGVKRSVSVVLRSLSSAVTYHARVVVASAVGRVGSPDVAFTTLVDPQAARVAAAGDIACSPNAVDFNGGLGTATTCRQMAVSNAILAGAYDAVLPLGDEQYPAGTGPAFAASYHPSWGRLNPIAHPVPGNHEYGTPGAVPYYQYFGASAGTAGQGWYSYELGSWHVVALNSNCAFVTGGCGSGSPQEVWLRADLAAHPAACTLAYWHHPLFTSGQEVPAVEMSTIWADLTSAGADVVVNGHNHDYERFAPQSATAQLDVAHGMREFVVGTGGFNHMALHKVRAGNTEASDSTSFGFLGLTLGSGSYSWRFVPTAPDAFTDSGTASCH
jgi:hypothetical protein